MKSFTSIYRAIHFSSCVIIPRQSNIHQTSALRLPVFFPVSLFHLHLYFTEILSVLTAQCRYCPTLIQNYTELNRCKDTTFIFISCNFSHFSFAFLFQYIISLSACGTAVFRTASLNTTMARHFSIGIEPLLNYTSLSIIVIHSFRHPIGTTNTPSSGRLYA